MTDVWRIHNIQYQGQPVLSNEENMHFSALIREYRECKEQMCKLREEGLPQAFERARRARNKKRKELWTFCAEHGLPNITVSHGTKKGVQDLDGKTILPAVYDEFCRTDDEIERRLPTNYFVCRKGCKWGVVDRHNKTRIPFEYDRVFRFVNSPYLFYVEKAEKKGLVKLTPFEVYDRSGKRVPKQEETMTFLIPCEMDDIYFVQHKNLFVFRQTVNGGDKFGWYWETAEHNPKSFSPCIYDELYIPVPWQRKSMCYDDDFFEARRGKTMDYILIWTHQC
jgi:hypothetical protein